jgi:hypothetical protein
MRGRLVYTLNLPEPTPSNNELRGMHYRVYKKTREEWRDRVAAAVPSLPAKPLQKAFIEVERYCGTGGLDWDNVYGGLKPLLDCLVAQSAKNPDGLGFIQDDGPKFIPVRPDVTQHPAKRGAGRTVVRIYEAV